MERHELPALIAQQVMVVVLAGGIGRLVAGDPVADIDPADEIVRVEELEDPVHAGPPHGPLTGPLCPPHGSLTGPLVAPTAA